MAKYVERVIHIHVCGEFGCVIVLISRVSRVRLCVSVSLFGAVQRLARQSHQITWKLSQWAGVEGVNVNGVVHVSTRAIRDEAARATIMRHCDTEIMAKLSISVSLIPLPLRKKDVDVPHLNLAECPKTIFLGIFLASSLGRTLMGRALPLG